MKNIPGSPEQGEPLYLVVGRIRRSHGLMGEMLFEIITDFPERIVPGVELFVGDMRRPVVFRQTRHHNKGLIIQIDGVNSIEETEAYRNQMVYVPADRLPELPVGEYYFHELIGLRVFDEDENLLGILDEIMETGANDVYIIKNDEGNEILIPSIESVIIRIDLENNKMVVSPQDYY